MQIKPGKVKLKFLKMNPKKVCLTQEPGSRLCPVYKAHIVLIVKSSATFIMMA